MTVPRLLDPIEIRILGSLLEKEQATPEYYPLTLNAIALACNQKSNREPGSNHGEREIEAALDRLQDEKLVWRIVGGRATRWQHNLEKAWNLAGAAKAVMTLLLLRGAQTPGELRARADRLFDFASLEEIESTLRSMAESDPPLIAELPRRPGQKETRWIHLAGLEPPKLPDLTGDGEANRERMPVESTSSRIERMETTVAELRRDLEALKALLGA